MANEKQIANCVCGGRGRLIQSDMGFSVRCEFDPGLHTAPVYIHSIKAIVRWNYRQATMDNLDRMAVIAYHKRTSYGKLPPDMLKQIEQPQTMSVREEKNGTPSLLCAVCGRQIPPYSKRKLYCSPECAEKAGRQQKKERIQLTQKEDPAKSPQIPCAVCGKLFPQRGTKKYCSPICSDIGLRNRKNEASRRYREKIKENR